MFAITLGPNIHKLPVKINCQFFNAGLKPYSSSGEMLRLSYWSGSLRRKRQPH